MTVTAATEGKSGQALLNVVPKAVGSLEIVPGTVSLQAVGAAAGNMFCIHNVVAASATVGLLGQEGITLRRTIIPTIYYCVLAGIIGLVAIYVFGYQDPLSAFIAAAQG